MAAASAFEGEAQQSVVDWAPPPLAAGAARGGGEVTRWRTEAGMREVG